MSGGGPGGSAEGQSFTLTDLLWRLAVVLLLTFLAQTFTGLNIGLFTLDCGQLQVLIDVPGEKENPTSKEKSTALYAKTILPLRRKGNLLLCTILLANTIVNASMAIFLAGMTSGFLGWLLTTLIIVYLGEILPQSVCTRHGLLLGAYGAPIIWVAVLLLYPITKIYALALDRLFPDEESLKDRKGWEEMVHYMQHVHQNEGLPENDETSMLLGALRLENRTISDVMVPMQNAFYLQDTDELNFDAILRIQKNGFTRFPVYDAKQRKFVGLLHCKDLLRVDLGVDWRSGQSPPVHKLLNALEKIRQRRELFEVDKSMTLLDLLAEFKKGRPHLAVVSTPMYHSGVPLGHYHPHEDHQAPPAHQYDSDNARRPSNTSQHVQHVGIVTLHDVLKCIFQEQGDNMSENSDFDERPDEGTKRSLVHSGAIRLLDNRSTREDGELKEPEAMAVLAFLQATQSCFGQEHISEQELLKLILEMKARYLAKDTELAQKHESNSVAILVLQGQIEVKSGREAITSVCGCWSCLGMRNLEPPVGLKHALRNARSVELLEHHDAHDYIPDFTAKVVSNNARIIGFTRTAYLNAYHRTQLAGIRQRSRESSRDAKGLAYKDTESDSPSRGPGMRKSITDSGRPSMRDVAVVDPA